MLLGRCADSMPLSALISRPEFSRSEKLTLNEAIDALQYQSRVSI